MLAIDDEQRAVGVLQYGSAWRGADGREAVLGHSGRLCAAIAACAAQVENQAPVECAAKLPRRRHRLRFDRIEEAMVFGRADDRAPLAG